MKKNFTHLVLRAVHLSKYPGGVAGMLLLLFMLIANAVTAQTITSISPTCATANQGFTLTVTGTGFNTAGGSNPAIVTINGSAANITVTSRNSTTVVASVAASRILTAGIYQVRISQKGGSEISSPVDLTVIGAPTAQPVQRCGAGEVTLNASGAPQGAAYQWYDPSGNAIPGATGSSYTTSVSVTATYAVSMTAPSSTTTPGGCVSTRTNVAVTINPVPDAPSTTSRSRCGNGSVQLSASGAPNGGSYRWYTQETGGTAISGATAANFDTPNLTTTTTYYVSAVSPAGCESGRTAVTATINPLPAAPTVEPVSRCGEGTVNLSATLGANSPTARWYTNSSGGTPVATGSSFSPNISATTTYYVSGYNETTGCESSSRTAVEATVLQTPTVSISTNSPTTICGEGAVLLSATVRPASPATGSYRYQWFNGNDAIAGATGNNFSAEATGNYSVVVSTSTSNCSSERSNVIEVTVSPNPTLTITNPDPVCSPTTVDLTDPAIKAGSTSGLTYTYWRNAAATTVLNNPDAVTQSGTYYIKGTTDAGCFVVEPVTVTINTAPTASVSGSNSFCEGGSTTLDANEVNGATYQWLLNGEEIDGENERTLTVDQAGDYAVVVSRGGCSTTSDEFTVTETTLPEAVITPESDTEFCEGGSVVLNASTGAGYTYRWFRQGSTTVLGAQASFTASNTGNYYVEVTRNTCVVTSGIVEVIETELPSATITPVGPVDFCEGGSVRLDAPENPNYTYQWFLNSEEIQNSTAASLTVRASGSYTVVVNNNGCESTSAPIVVRVSTQNTAAIHVIPPTTFCRGGSAELTANVAPEGQPAYTYRWLKDGATIPGETENKYSASESGDYQVVVSNGTCTKTSEPVTITVNPLPTATISGATTFCEGGSVTLRATEGTNYTYQWFRGDDAIPGATEMEYAASLPGNYTVRVTSGSGCSTMSAGKAVTMNPSPVATINTNGPTTFCEGSSVTLSAVPAPQGRTYSYQWLRNGEEIAENGTGRQYAASIAGDYTVRVTDTTNGLNCTATTATPTTVTVNPRATASITVTGQTTFCAGGSVELTASEGASYEWSNGATTQSIIVKDPGNYTVTVTNAAGCSATSEATRVTVNPVPVAKINPEGSTSFCTGGSVTLVSQNTETGYSYAWFRNGGSTAVGTGSSLTVRDAGSYTLEITSAGCTATSDATVVTETPLPVADAGAAKSICSGETVQLGTPAVAGYTYEWEPAGGLSSTTAAQPTVTLSNSGTNDITRTYTLTVTANGCTAKSEVVVTVKPLPEATISANGAPTTFCQGGSVKLTASAGSAYQWLLDGQPLEGATAQDLTVEASGSYRVQVTGSNDCSATSAAVSVTVVPGFANNTITSNQTVCYNTAPGTLDGTPTGGTGTYTYAWESSTDGTAFTVISNATSRSYSPGALTTSTWFRRKTTSGSCSEYTNAVKITVNPAIVNTLAATDQTICSGGTAATINGDPASGGVGNYTYLWESSTTSATSGFGAAAGVNSNQNYTPGALTATTWFRRKVSSAGCNSNSAVVKVTVNPAIAANTLTSSDQTVCSGSPATTITGGTPTGGNGTYTYTWESSTTSATAGFATASGTSNGINYSPGIISQTTWFRRKVTSGTCESFSAAVQVTVSPAITNNNLTGTDQTICSGGTPATLNASLPTGGTGTYTYTWQGSTTSATSGFANIASSNVQNYAPGTLTATTWFRRVVTSGGCTSTTSTAIKVTVNPVLGRNDISATQTTICTGQATAQLTGSIPTGGGGSGTYIYAWESSTTSATAGFAAAAGTNNGINYSSPAALTQTTWYRRIVTSGGCTSTSAIVQITVNPVPAQPDFTASTYFSGEAPSALVGSPAGGTFSGSGVTGSVATGFTFNPCAAFGTSTQDQITVPITYTVSSGGCSSSVMKNVTIKRSTYKVVVMSSIKPFCQGDNVTHTAYVYRDADITYPYLTNANGDPVRADGVTPIGAMELPVSNPNYPFPAGTSDLVKANAYRYFNPIVNSGTEVKSGLTYDWTKNQGNRIGNKEKTFSNAGLSSLDYYSVYVTASSGSCGPNFTDRLGSRTYTSQLNNYTIALSVDKNPICPGEPVAFTATLNSAFTSWGSINLKLNWLLNGTKIHETAYSGNSSALQFAYTGQNGALKNGDVITISFTSDADQFDQPGSKCIGGEESSAVTMTVNAPPLVTAQPVAQTAVCAGQTVTYTIGATGTGITYQWYKRPGNSTTGVGTAVSNVAGKVSGATTGTLTINNVNANDAGYYYALVSGACPPANESANAQLIVNQLPLARTVSGSNFCPLTSPNGGTVELQGSEPGVVYRLMKGVEAVQTLTGTGNALVFGPHAAGDYTITATTTSNCTNSNVGQATITRTEPPVVSGELTIYWRDNDTRWEVTALSDHVQKGVNMNGFTYEWYKGTSEANATLLTTTAYPTNTISIADPAIDTYIRCVIKAPNGMCVADLIMDSKNVTPLPVELIYLKAEKRGKDVRVEWATASEDGNKGFEVQVSTDGKVFRTLDFVASKDSDSRIKLVYEYLDTENGKYGTRYYRLKQIDHDGKFEYFGAKAVTFEVAGNKIKVYPNPFESEVELSIDAEVDGEVLITVTSTIGKQLLQRTIQVKKGMNVEKMILDPTLPKGIYIVTTRMGDLNSTFKLLKK